MIYVVLVQTGSETVLGNMGMPRPETKRSSVFGKIPDLDWDHGVWSGPDQVPISPGLNFPNSRHYHSLYTQLADTKTRKKCQLTPSLICIFCGDFDTTRSCSLCTFSAASFASLTLHPSSTPCFSQDFWCVTASSSHFCYTSSSTCLSLSASH